MEVVDTARHRIPSAHGATGASCSDGSHVWCHTQHTSHT